MAASVRRALRVEHADQARSPAGQRDKRERSGLGVEFRRRVLMRPRVREIERQRGLRIGVPMTADPGRGAAERVLAVGSDDKPHARFAFRELHCDAVVIAARQRQRER